ncbi:MAG TPA: serine/threonine-protein kinase [Thermoanaerobaculia bacterium]
MTFRAFPVLGQTLGPYRLVRGIALGGKSAVFRGLDERSGREVAVKIPIEGALAGEVSRQRLRREGLMLSRIGHPGVVARLDEGSRDDLDFLVMELVEGPTLAQRLQSGPLEEAAVLDLGARIGEVLEAVHRSGVIHCDLKPGNVVLTAEGVKLLDFGQARLAGEADPPGESFIEAAGTVSYMAPERFQGWKADPRADVWSLGVLLYEAAAGVRPFRGEGIPAVIRAILSEAPAPLSRRLDPFVRNLLEKDPNKRGSLRSPLDGLR